RRDPPAPEVRFVLVAASAWPRTPPVGREDEFVRSTPDGAGFGYGDYGTATPEGDGFGDGGSLAPVDAPSALWAISAIIHKRRSQPSQNENTGGLEVWDVTTKTLASRDFELIAKRTGAELLEATLERLQATDPELKVVPLEQVAEVLQGASYERKLTT